MKWYRSLFSLGVGVSLALSGGLAIAQETINADGNSGAAHPGSPAVDADGPTVVYGDVNTGPGTNNIGPPLSTTSGSSNVPVVPVIPGADISATDGNAAAIGPGSATAAPGTVNGGSPGTSLLGPDGTYSVSDNPDSNVNVGNNDPYVPLDPAPVYDDTTYVEPVENAPVDTATALDSDNDGIADADETNIYGTDPYNWDTDGDGLGDGEEAFVTGTSPVTWDDTSGTAASDGSTDAAASELATDSAATGDAAADSDGDRLADADEAALGTDPGNPDTDGDGYYDGDEAALGSDPFDAGSMPTA
ncbi:MAG: hypothetical protein U0Z70_14260 [Thermomicrobiales bacterium]